MRERALRSLRVAGCGILLAAPVHAQNGAQEFAALWGEFVSFCGEVIVSPDTALEVAKPLAQYSEFNASHNGERSEVLVEHLDPREFRTLSFTLLQKEQGYDLFCEASTEGAALQSPAITLGLVKSMIEAGGMRASGGAMHRLPISRSSIGAEIDDQEVNSLIIQGAFPGRNIAVQTHLSTEVMTLQVHTSLREADEQ